MSAHQFKSHNNSSKKAYPKGRSKKWLSCGLETLSKTNLSQSAESVHYDVAIIGSGYGGSIAASELSNQYIEDNGSKRPIRICVLERGKEFLPGMFPKELAEIPKELRLRRSPESKLSGAAEGLYDIRVGNDVGVLVGNGLGGGSLINAGVMEAPTPDVFDEHWPALIRNADADEMNNLFIETKALLGASLDNQNDNSIAAHSTFQASGLNKYTGLKKLAKFAPQQSSFRPAAITVAMSDKISTGKVNLNQCKLCGDCATGCNHGSKESLDTNLLHKAWVNGVDIFTGSTVLDIEKNENIWTLNIVYTNHKMRRREANNTKRKNGVFKLKAGKVILAAGTLGSTELLLKSAHNIGLSNSNIGRRFSSNGDMLAAGCDMDIQVNAVACEDTDPDKRFVGPTCTGVVDLREKKNRSGIVIEELAVPGPLKQIYTELFLTSNTLHEFDRCDWSRHTTGQPSADPFSNTDDRARRLAIYAIMSDDNAEGVMSLAKNSAHFMQDSNLKITWKDLKTKQIFKDQISTLKELNTRSKLGGRIIANPGWSPIPESMSFLFDNDKGALFTVHPLGGCAMGDLIESAVVDHYGRVFKSGAEAGGSFDDLIILDGSIIPTAIGINPALTIAAMSLRAIRGLKTVWNLADNPVNDFENSSPVSRPVYRDCNKSIKKKETIVQVMERLSGNIDILDKNGFYRSRHMELTLYFDETPVKYLTELIQSKNNPEIIHKNRTLKISNSKSPSTLKIFGPEYNSHAINNPEPEFVAQVDGHLEIFKRENSSSYFRMLRGLYAWFFNRGLRDITQARFKKPWEKKPSKKPLKIKALNLLSRLKNIFQIASRAGESRLFEYRLNATNIKSTGDMQYSLLKNDFSFKAIKRICYTRRGNPWRQLMQARIEKFPAPLKQHPPPLLNLDLDFLTKNSTPLLRIKKQNNQVNALVDICALLTYITRLIISIHIWSFPKPDTWKKTKPAMLAGRIPGISKDPEIVYLPVNEGKNLSIPHVDSICRLTYYAGSNSLKPPILLIHGYSTSSTTFSHASIPNNLVYQLHEDGRDVWLLDLRTSIGMEHTCYKPWSFEDAAHTDIPLALDYIYKLQKRSIHVLAHCIGGAMFSMAILGDSDSAKKTISNLSKGETIHDFYSKRVNSVILSQVGPYVNFTPANAFRAYLTNYFLSIFETQTYQFRPEKIDSISNQVIDRLLSSLPYPEEEFHEEYPFWPPWKRTSYTGLRHRMDFLYGRTFKLTNIDSKVLDKIDDIFGPPNLKTISQTIHLARYGIITDRKGYNRYVSTPRLKSRWTFPTCLIHGQDNGLSDVRTIWELEKQLNAAHCIVSPAEPIQNAGHQDCYIGKSVTAVGKKIIRHLSNCERSEHISITNNKTIINSVHFHPPWLGPIWLGSALKQTEPNSCILSYRVSIGVVPDQIKPDMLLPIPVLFDAKKEIYIPCSSTPIEYITQIIDKYKNNEFNIQNNDNSYWFNMEFELPLAEMKCDGILCLLIYRDGIKNNTADNMLHRIKNFETYLTTHHPTIAASILSTLKRTPQELLEQSLIPFCVDSDSSNLSFALGSCQYPANMLDQIPAHNSYHQLANYMKTNARDTIPAFVILTGDQVYTDASAGICDPSTVQNRFVIPYYRWLENQDVRYVLRKLPSYMMLDDHEILDNYEPGSPTRTQKKYRASGVKSYLNFQRAHWPPGKTKKTGDRLWNSFSRNGFDFFMLDTRTTRDERSTQNREACHLISREQWRDLENWISINAKKNKPLFLISPSMPFPRHIDLRNLPETSIHLDNWAGYPASINYLLNLIVEHKPENLIILSGDEHISNVAKIKISSLSSNEQHSFYSVHSSGLYSPFPFANSTEEDFSRQDNFIFQTRQSKNFECSTRSIFLPGDGFAIIKTKNENGNWRLFVEFMRGENNTENRLVDIQALEDITHKEI